MRNAISPIPALMNDLGGYPFEDFLAEFFERRGWNVRQTPYSGDKGKDLFVTHPDSQARYAIEAKNWMNSAFSAKNIERYVQIAKDPDIDGLLIVCTDKARKGTLAKLRGQPKIRIVNRTAVFDEIQRYREVPLLTYHTQYRVKNDRTDSEALQKRCTLFKTNIQQGAQLSPTARDEVIQHPNRDLLLARLETEPPKPVITRPDIEKMATELDDRTTEEVFGLSEKWIPSKRAVGYW